MKQCTSKQASSSENEAPFFLLFAPFLPASSRQKPVRERLAHTSSSSGDNFAALYAVLPFMLCYAMTVKNNLIIFYRLSTDLLAILGLKIILDGGTLRGRLFCGK